MPSRSEVGGAETTFFHTPLTVRLVMSASGYKRTLWSAAWSVRFAPKSRHSDAQERLGLEKRTLDVRLAPKSGHKRVCRGMSAFDPKRTFTASGA